MSSGSSSSSVVDVVETTSNAERRPAGAAAAPAPAVITKERVPDSFIQRIKARPYRRLGDLPEEIDDPADRAELLSFHARCNAVVDLNEDVLRQYSEKGYAELGVDFTGGVKRLFILPQPDLH